VFQLAMLAPLQRRFRDELSVNLAAALEAGLSLADALAAARAVYGPEFNGARSLKALIICRG
jgi:hypothetical protein